MEIDELLFCGEFDARPIEPKKVQKEIEELCAEDTELEVMLGDLCG